MKEVVCESGKVKRNRLKNYFPLFFQWGAGESRVAASRYKQQGVM